MVRRCGAQSSDTTSRALAIVDGRPRVGRSGKVLAQRLLHRGRGLLLDRTERLTVAGWSDRVDELAPAWLRLAGWDS